MLPITIQHNLGALAAAIQRYQALTGKAMPEVIDRKARSLGIRLFGMFRDRQWGGNPKRKGIAADELRERSAQGKGITVRPSLLRELDTQRINNARLRLGLLPGAKARTLSKAQKRQLTSLRKSRASLWRKTVGRELKARNRGIGVLAASFLWYRSRTTKSRGTYYVRNRTGESLGYLESADGLARIVAETPGIKRIGDRYGLVAAAIAAEAADTDDFIRRRYIGLFQEARGAA